MESITQALSSLNVNEFAEFKDYLEWDVDYILYCFFNGLPSLDPKHIVTPPSSCFEPCEKYAGILRILTEKNAVVYLTDMMPLIDEYLEYITFQS